MYIARADERLRAFEVVERATELDKLKKELEELKNFTPTSSDDEDGANELF